ncbi:hypothetical protein GCM10022214_05900 [Actinomadura miaoliensis]|uniref:Uncharacterized protein n=1 Tax=Actinomadura miaoliensis TaxID=430685 RepID=A0ABP7V2V9_9ACTN
MRNVPQERVGMLGLLVNSLCASTVTQMLCPGAGKYIRAFPLMLDVEPADGVPWADAAFAAETADTVVVTAANTRAEVRATVDLNTMTAPSCGNR